MKRILIVEDEAALLRVYVMLFKMHKFSVSSALDGKAALKQLDKVKPDVIVLDLLMPVMGGIQFLGEAKLKKRYPQTKVLVLTNLSDAKSLKQIKKMGADKYLLKAGVSPSELVKNVNHLLAHDKTD